MIEIPDGQLFIDEIDIKNIKLGDLRKYCNRSSRSILFTSTISENISFGEPKASQTLVKKSAIKAGLIDDINNFPHKFKTIVGERGITQVEGKGKEQHLEERYLLILQ